MKKLVFVRPPFEGMGYYKPPHLGIATLYGYLNKLFPTIEFSFIDALPYNLSVEQVIERIIMVKPDFIAFTVKTMQFVQTTTVIEKIKKVYSPIIICGGNHISADPFGIIDAGADYAILGEGEIAFERILKFELGKESNSILDSPNIVTQFNKNSFTPHPIIELKGEDIPTPNWSIMNILDYNENIHLNKGNAALPVMASRGCPFKCDFCSTHLTWTTKVRYRKAEDVLMEIMNNKEIYHINDYHFYDDNLMLDRKWLIHFLNLIENANFKFNWICLSRPDIIIKNKDLLPRMRKNGCKGLELGFETEDDGLYLKMNKKNTKTIFRETYELLCKESFEMIEFLLMCFYDGETLYSLYETYSQLRKYKTQKALFVSSRYFATPFYGTSYYEKTINNGYNIGVTDKYKYALFLNFMPKSFLNSPLTGFSINNKALKIQLRFIKIDSIIYKKDFETISNVIEVKLFCEIFNCLASEGKIINDLCAEISIISNNVKIYAIYEYVGRMIEYAISKGVITYEENSVL